jgi:hypothetical protein
VDDGAGAARSANGLAAPLAQDAGEGDVDALEAAQRTDRERRRPGGERLDQFVGALVSLPPLADAAIHNLFQVIGARQAANLVRPNPRVRVSLDQHAQQLPHLIDIVARLPARYGAREDVARRRQRVHRARGDASPIALLPHDAEIPELQTPAVTDEDVQRREIAVERLAAMQLAQHLEDAGDFAPRRALRPSFRRATVRCGSGAVFPG